LCDSVDRDSEIPQLLVVDYTLLCGNFDNGKLIVQSGMVRLTNYIVLVSGGAGHQCSVWSLGGWQ
jgi:hypothetical protein